MASGCQSSRHAHGQVPNDTLSTGAAILWSTVGNYASPVEQTAD